MADKPPRTSCMICPDAHFVTTEHMLTTTVLFLSLLQGHEAPSHTAQTGLTWGEFDRETQLYGLATTGLRPLVGSNSIESVWKLANRDQVQRVDNLFDFANWLHHTNGQQFLRRVPSFSEP